MIPASVCSGHLDGLCPRADMPSRSASGPRPPPGGWRRKAVTCLGQPSCPLRPQDHPPPGRSPPLNQHFIFNFGHLGCQNSLPTQECQATTYYCYLPTFGPQPMRSQLYLSMYFFWKLVHIFFLKIYPYIFNFGHLGCQNSLTTQESHYLLPTYL